MTGTFKGNNISFEIFSWFLAYEEALKIVCVLRKTYVLLNYWYPISMYHMVNRLH